MSTTLSLSEILGRGVAVEWFEAVALVREVADRVRDSTAGRGAPELDQVQLADDGTISITGSAKTDEPVRRMGQLLQACLVQAEPPVQLRLAVAQATAPDPGYASIRDYSEALAYFERPDRTAVLRSLYARAQLAPARQDEALPTLDAIAPLDVPDAQKRPHQATRRPASRPVVATLAAVVVLVVGATAYSQFGSAAPEVSTLALKASDAVGTTLVKGISVVSESVGLGRLAPADASGSPAPVSAPVQSIPKTVQRDRSSARSSASTSFRLFDLGTPPVQTGVPTTVGTAQTITSTPADVAVALVHPPDETVYSPDDSAVTPPVGVRPQLPRILPGDVSPDRLSEIELVILANGTVGSVKLLGGRRGVPEGMLLSAAKAWKFKPAEKDGHPVAYRKIVWLVRD